MHAAFLVAEVLDDPHQDYLDMNRKITKVPLRLPAIGKRRVDTLIEYHSYKEDIGLRKGDMIIDGCQNPSQLQDTRVVAGWWQRRASSTSMPSL